MATGVAIRSLLGPGSPLQAGGPVRASTAPAAAPARASSGPWMSGMTGGGAAASSGGALPLSAGAATQAPPLTLKADTNQALEALSGNYSKHLKDLSSNTGHFMDIAGSRIRDAREGGRQALQEGSLFAGRASDPALAQYDAETTGAQAGAIADIAAGREANLTNALIGGVGVMGAPADMALREKGQQISAYEAQQGANNANFNRMLALLNATRTSPIYTG